MTIISMGFSPGLSPNEPTDASSLSLRSPVLFAVACSLVCHPGGICCCCCCCCCRCRCLCLCCCLCLCLNSVALPLPLPLPFAVAVAFAGFLVVILRRRRRTCCCLCRCLFSFAIQTPCHFDRSDSQPHRESRSGELVLSEVEWNPLLCPGPLPAHKPLSLARSSNPKTPLLLGLKLFFAIFLSKIACQAPIHP